MNYIAIVPYNNPAGELPLVGFSGTPGGDLSGGIARCKPSAMPSPITGGKEIITVVATHDGHGPAGLADGAGWRLLTSVGSGALISRGVEFYDVDHNGFLDRCTIFFSEAILDAEDVTGSMPVRATALPITTASGSAAPPMSSWRDTVPRISMDNGGTGIRNAGAHGVTLFLKDGMFGTDERPQVTYASFEDTGTPIQYVSGPGTDINNIAASQATEVDKARPVLFSAQTGDTDGNGKIDQYVLTFSEPIDNFTKGGVFTMTEVGLSFGAASTFVSSAGVLTLFVNETGIINTGVVPAFSYNEDNVDGGALVLIQDFAKDATGAVAANQWEEDLTDYGRFDGDGDLVADHRGRGPDFVHQADGRRLAARDLGGDGRRRPRWQDRPDHRRVQREDDGPGAQERGFLRG